jgi:hypothetical protein
MASSWQLQPQPQLVLLVLQLPVLLPRQGRPWELPSEQRAHLSVHPSHR